MADSRRLEDLRPEFCSLVQLMMLRFEIETGVGLLVTSTRRSLDQQARLYRQGRSRAAIMKKAVSMREDGYAVPAEILLQVGPQTGPLVTNAGPGESLHQWGVAVDVVPLIDGNPYWTLDDRGKRLWAELGRQADSLGLEWGGYWRNPDRPHVQMAGIDWRRLMRERLADHHLDGLAMVV